MIDPTNLETLLEQVEDELRAEGLINDEPIASLEKQPSIERKLMEIEDELAQGASSESSLLPYVATPVSEELRKRLQRFLQSHPDLDEESAWLTLLERGLQKSE